VSEISQNKSVTKQQSTEGQQKSMDKKSMSKSSGNSQKKSRGIIFNTITLELKKKKYCFYYYL